MEREREREKDRKKEKEGGREGGIHVYSFMIHHNMHICTHAHNYACITTI